MSSSPPAPESSSSSTKLKIPLNKEQIQAALTKFKEKELAVHENYILTKLDNIRQVQELILAGGEDPTDRVLIYKHKKEDARAFQLFEQRLENEFHLFLHYEGEMGDDSQYRVMGFPSGN